MSPPRKQLIQDLMSHGLYTPVFEVHRGITENEAFVAHGVFKAGPPQAIEQELGIYRDLQARLGEQYKNIFPEVVLRHQGEQVVVIEMTWLGRSVNDEIFKPIAWGEWAAVLARWPDAPYIVAQLALADDAVAHTLKHYETIFEVSQQSNLSLAKTFTSETLAALRVNLQRAGLLPKLEHDLDIIEASHDMWSTGLVISCCHRDLMVEHIYLTQRDGAFDVRLADPRSCVPHFDEIPTSYARIPSSLGCVAVDFAHLELSLVRRQLELKHIHPEIEVTALKRIRLGVSDWVAKGRFSAAFYELALATWYVNYAGWPSALGKVPPPEKRWLYDRMVTEAYRRVARCATLARGEEVPS